MNLTELLDAMLRSDRYSSSAIHLGGVATTIDSFERSELCYDADVLSQRNGTIGGMLKVLEQQEARIVPLVVATSCPSGPLTAECYDYLKKELIGRLERAMPVDAARQVVGSSTPVVATLDLHAHVSKQMVKAANALIAWETYPHRDAYTTGERGAKMLLGMLAGDFKPTMALAKAPVIVGGVHSGTEGDAPFADVMRLAKSMEQEPGVLSTSAFLVHPYLDLPNMGGGGLVITDNDSERAAKLAEQVAAYYWSRRFDLEPEVFTPEVAIRQGLEVDGGPVLLAEVADTCGGGAAGDNVTTLKALLATRCDVPTMVPVVDPAAANICHSAGVGGK